MGFQALVMVPSLCLNFDIEWRFTRVIHLCLFHFDVVLLKANVSIIVHA